MLIPRLVGQSLRGAARPSGPRLFVAARQQPWRGVSQSRGEPQHNSSRSTSTESTGAASGEDTKKTETQGSKVEGLPAPGEGVKLDVSGEGSSVSLGHLGPLVVNRDGTTGRVSNWEAMTVHEKETTLKLLKKRNKARLDALKKDEEHKS